MQAMRQGFFGFTSLLVLSLLLAPPSWGGASPGKTALLCERSRTSVLVKGSKALGRCYADLYRDGDQGLADACGTEVAARAQRRIERLGRRLSASGYRCRGSLAELGLGGSGEGLHALFAARDALAAGQESESCGALRVAVVAKHLSRLAVCSGRGHGQVEACTAAAARRFLSSWTRIGARSSCVSLAAEGVEQAALAFMRDVRGSVAPVCGDGRLAGFEECDDGNVEDGDGCSTACRTELCEERQGAVYCRVCVAGAELNAEGDGCRCKSGYRDQDGACQDVDECEEAASASLCPAGRPCVNLPGTYACAIECTQQALEEALASCGAPTGAIVFNCRERTIPIDAASLWSSRRNYCDGLLIDGLDREIRFRLDPPCYALPLAAEDCAGDLKPDGSCACPDIDGGMGLLSLRGDANTVRRLTLKGFFEGIHVRGRNNTVEDVVFDRSCDDAFGTDGGSGHVFRRLTVRKGCDKCSQSVGNLADTAKDPRLREHYNASFLETTFEGCRQPLRMAQGGRWQLERLKMYPSRSDPAFDCSGPRFSSGRGVPMFVYLKDAVIDQCSRGLRFGAQVTGLVRDTTIAHSAVRGVRLAADATVLLANNRIVDNGGTFSSESGSGGVSVQGAARVDLGGGGLAIEGVPVTTGGNALCRNRRHRDETTNIENQSSQTVYALGNQFCTSSPYETVTGSVMLGE